MQKIIERIQKLLALAGNNANENEALAALEKAHALLAEHNLSVEQVGTNDQKASADEVRDALHSDTNMPQRYNRWVWNAVAKANSCLLYTNRRDPKKYKTVYSLIGRRINTIVAAQVAMYLCQTMKRLCAEHCKTLTATPDHAYKDAYLIGMAVRLTERVSEMTQKQGVALVLWSGEEEKRNREHVADMGVKLRQKKTPAKIKYNTAAVNAGKTDAERVSLSQQVGGGQRPAPALR